MLTLVWNVKTAQQVLLVPVHCLLLFVGPLTVHNFQKKI